MKRKGFFTNTACWRPGESGRDPKVWERRQLLNTWVGILRRRLMPLLSTSVLKWNSSEPRCSKMEQAGNKLKHLGLKEQFHGS